MAENQNNDFKKCDNCDKWPYIVIIILMLIISVLAFFTGLYFNSLNLEPKIDNKIVNTNTNSTTQSSTWVIDTKDLIVKIIWDKRCSSCQTTELITQMKTLPFLNWALFEELDFSDVWVKDLLKTNAITKIPAVIFNSNKISEAWFVQYLEETPEKLYSLNVWSEFDPFGEICDNWIDDNEDNLIDCADPTCSKDFKCAPKVDRPVADLYIMSYCPYWLQAQKWYLEVMSKLSKVADVNIKFVPYIMHAQKEADENVIQYCIQKNEKDKYTKYLNCFLAEDNKNEACRKEVWVDENKLKTCITSTKKEFSVDEKMKDTSKQFPDFDLDKTEALEAWVQGSPTFVLNGIKLDKMWRNAKAYADAICSTFKNKPKECNETFQNINFDPMFGFTSNWSNADSGCAQ